MFKKPRRTVERVFLHCSASDVAAHDDVSVMDLWHRQRGWSGVGYHFFIKKNGTIQKGRDIEKTPAAQKWTPKHPVKSGNRGTIAICLHGLRKDKFTAAQINALQKLCKRIDQVYMQAGGLVTFHGHKEVSPKACPVIDYKTILKLDEHGCLGI